MKAKFGGTCPECKRPIKVGQDIAWNRVDGARHMACANARLAMVMASLGYEVERPRYGRVPRGQRSRETGEQRLLRKLRESD